MAVKQRLLLDFMSKGSLRLTWKQDCGPSVCPLPQFFCSLFPILPSLFFVIQPWQWTSTFSHPPSALFPFPLSGPHMLPEVPPLPTTHQLYLVNLCPPPCLRCLLVFLQPCVPLSLVQVSLPSPPWRTSERKQRANSAGLGEKRHLRPKTEKRASEVSMSCLPDLVLLSHPCAFICAKR